MLGDDKYNEAVEVRLARSPVVCGLVIAAGGFTSVLMLVLPLPSWLKPLLAAWAACAALHALDRALGARSLRITLDGVAEVDGVAGALRHPCFVAPWLTVVRWRPAGARFDRTALVVPGMLPAEDFRRLRVLLAWR